ncbi:MAG: CBS domain-containing protein, partial [Spirochaetales bacterium]|nr:CBS domain-containing protein [Spirochaetales bacterium]
MKKEKIHRLPVLDRDKNLIGVISEKDILFATPS